MTATATATHEITGQELDYEPDERYLVALAQLTFYLPDPAGYDGHTGHVIKRGAHPPIAADQDTVRLLLQTGALTWLSDDVFPSAPHGRRVG